MLYQWAKIKTLGGGTRSEKTLTGLEWEVNLRFVGDNWLEQVPKTEACTRLYTVIAEIGVKSKQRR